MRSPMRMRVDEILRGRDEGEPEQAIRDELVALGPGAIEAVVDILIGAEPPLATGFAELVEQGGGYDELLLRTLDSWPAAAVVAAVKEYTLVRLADMDFDDQLQSMAILGRVGGADALEPMFEIIAQAEPIQLLRPTVQQKIEGPLIQIFARDDACLRKLAAGFDEVQPELWPSLARVIGANMRHQGIDLLESMLGRNPELDQIVLAQLARLDQRDWVLHSDRAADVLRGFLTSADRRLRKQAVTSLGELRYVDAFPEIVARLDDVDRSVQQGAAWAVQTASGLPWKISSAEWEVWFAGQQDWLARVELELARDVLHEDPARAIRAIRTLSERPVFRNRLAQMIAPATAHSQESVVLFACNALVGLDSPFALQDLIELLMHDSQAVRKAAHESLAQISGQELPLDYVAWSSWLGGWDAAPGASHPDR